MSVFTPKVVIRVELAVDEVIEKVERLVEEGRDDPKSNFKIDEDYLFGTLEDVVVDYFRQRFEEANNCTDEEDFRKNDCFDHFELNRMSREE